MVLDLSKLRGVSLVNKETNPREIFNLLPEKNIKYQYLRDVQAEVLGHWHERRTEKDVVIKMNTGGGKTIVGLLLLKSCLNEGVGPAIYVVPDNYLISQVEKEAEQLGVDIAREPDAPSVLQGKAIAVINVHKLFNGKSKFGVGDQGEKLEIASIVIDDAHACINTIESQFTIKVDSTHQVFTEILALFRNDLQKQSEASLLELESGDPNSIMLVPFWSWKKHQQEVAEILSNHRNDEVITFSWPLLKNYLLHSRCVIAGKSLEITPRCIPIEALPSFVSAKRRVFMTATLADDSILVSDLNADPQMVSNQITPKTANDIGDRMILAPQEIDSNIDDDALKRYLKEKSQKYNVVVIVPSKYRSEFWESVADEICDASAMEGVVNKLKSQHIGLVVFINKYDGIDLPGDACRILVLDGLPQARRLIEKVENNFLGKSREVLGKKIQRLEQGIGRGVRANDDYCVVLLMGSDLTRALYSSDAKEMFSPATLAQLELSSNITDQIVSGIEEIDDAIGYCLEQKPEWKTLARESLVGVGYSEAHIRPIAIAQREAFQDAIIGDNASAFFKMQQVINQADQSDKSILGWLNWQLAEYQEYNNSIDAQLILKKAIGLNRRLTKPLDGISYERLKLGALEQSKNATWKLRSYGNDVTKFHVDINGILDHLKFAPETYKQFENAMCDVAEVIGFKTQNPESEYGKGPDVLWATGELNYFVIECKNGAISPMVNKHDCNQLTGSVTWFNDMYDDSCSCTPLLIHPSNVFEHASTPAPGTKVMGVEELDAFKNDVLNYTKAVGAKIATIEHNEVFRLLKHHNLTPDKILQIFTKNAKNKN